MMAFPENPPSVPPEGLLAYLESCAARRELPAIAVTADTWNHDTLTAATSLAKAVRVIYPAADVIMAHEGSRGRKGTGHRVLVRCAAGPPPPQDSEGQTVCPLTPVDGTWCAAVQRHLHDAVKVVLGGQGDPTDEQLVLAGRMAEVMPGMEAALRAGHERTAHTAGHPVPPEWETWVSGPRSPPSPRHLWAITADVLDDTSAAAFRHNMDIVVQQCMETTKDKLAACQGLHDAFGAKGNTAYQGRVADWLLRCSALSGHTEMLRDETERDLWVLAEPAVVRAAICSWPAESRVSRALRVTRILVDARQVRALYAVVRQDYEWLGERWEHYPALPAYVHVGARVWSASNQEELLPLHEDLARCLAVPRHEQVELTLRKKPDGEECVVDCVLLGVEGLPDTCDWLLQATGDLVFRDSAGLVLPETFGDLVVGRDLVLEGLGLRALPECIGRLRVGRDLRLGGNRLVSLPLSFAKIIVGRELFVDTYLCPELPARFKNMPLTIRRLIKVPANVAKGM